MNFLAFKAFVLEECSDSFSDKVLSNAIFRAIRDAQEECLCSFYTYNLTVSTATYGTSVRRVPLASVSYSLESFDYGYSAATSTGGFPIKQSVTVQPIYVHSVFDVTNGDPDGDDSFDLSDKDVIDRGIYSSDDGPFMAVSFDRSSLCLFSNSDLDNKILRIRCNFVVEYPDTGEIADRNIGDIYLATVPIQVRRYLEAGVKAYLYRYLAMDLQRDDLKERFAFYKDEWHRKFLPMISQMITQSQPKGLVYSPVAPFIIDPKD